MRRSSTYSLLLCQVTRGAQDDDNGVVLELLVAVWMPELAIVAPLPLASTSQCLSSCPSISDKNKTQEWKLKLRMQIETVENSGWGGA